MENMIASGKAQKKEIQLDAVFVSPNLSARKQLACIMNSIIKDEYTSKKVLRELEAIRENRLVSSGLKTEAGYILVLVRMIDKNKKDMAKSRQENDACILEKDQLKKQLDEYKYKLEKLQQIYIDTEKRRDMQ
jgi:hypothetical protein